MNYLVKQKIIVNFAVAGRIAEAPVWGYMRRDVVNIVRKRLSALILDELECLANFHLDVKG